MSPFVAAIAFLAVVFLYMRSIYVRLADLCSAGDSLWSDIDEMLSMRHDLVAALVETVEKHGACEKRILDRVGEVREEAMRATTPSERSRAESVLQSTLESLFALAENCHELQSSESFIEQEKQLAYLGNRIRYARTTYNAVIRELNARIDTAPGRLIANLVKYRKREYFELDNP